IPDDNFSIPEGEEDLAKAIQMVQEQATDTQILVKIALTIQLVCSEISEFLPNEKKMNVLRRHWYELLQKGVAELRDVGNVPDVYSQNMLLENENKNLKKELKHYKQAAEYVIF
ncbi:Sperm-associated antigen 16 protein, partial [Camelus dromedarius]